MIGNVKCYEIMSVTKSTWEQKDFYKGQIYCDTVDFNGNKKRETIDVSVNTDDLVEWHNLITTEKREVKNIHICAMRSSSGKLNYCFVSAKKM